jgi:hypothetical protein
LANNAPRKRHVFAVAQIGIGLGVAFGVQARLRGRVFLPQGARRQQGFFQGGIQLHVGILEGFRQLFFKQGAVLDRLAIGESRLHAIQDAQYFLLGLPAGQNFFDDFAFVFALLGYCQGFKISALPHVPDAFVRDRKVQAQRPFDGDLEIAEILVVENLADDDRFALVAAGVDVGLDILQRFPFVMPEAGIDGRDRGNMVRFAARDGGEGRRSGTGSFAVLAFAEFLALVAQAFLHFPGELGGVDELHLTLALRRFPVGDDQM